MPTDATQPCKRCGDKCLPLETLVRDAQARARVDADFGRTLMRVTPLLEDGPPLHTSYLAAQSFHHAWSRLDSELTSALVLVESQLCPRCWHAQVHERCGCRSCLAVVSGSPKLLTQEDAP